MNEEVRRRLTSQSTLENLKKEAKRWLKALRADDAEARERFLRSHPQPPTQPNLRDVQHALAREHGLTGWAELKRQVAAPPIHDLHSQRVAWFLEQACPDWHTGGPPAQYFARQAAQRLLDRHPEIAGDSLYTAVVVGNLDEVERILSHTPQAAISPGGVKGWQPLHYLCFARLRLRPSNDQNLAMARALLDRGADPNAYFSIGAARHTPMVGLIGEGEESRSPHPQAEALIRLLLERGADPCDGQVIYNVTEGQGEDPCRWPRILYERSVAIGRQADWTDAARSTGLHNMSPLNWLLSGAVSRNQGECAEWLLSRGADPNTRSAGTTRSLYEEAIRRDFSEMAALLLRFGAPTTVVELSYEEAFVAACFRLDGEAVRTLLDRHPKLLLSPQAILLAAGRDRRDVVELLLDLGVPIEVEDAQKQRPLHAAASANAIHVAQLLIDRGAEIDPRESQWGNTPLESAVYGQKREMVDLLSRYTRDVFQLTSLGKVGRLREVLGRQPGLAKAKDKRGATTLMWVRDDRRALEVIELLLAHGADHTVRLETGESAADLYEKRGLEEAANALRWLVRSADDPAHANRVATFLRDACPDWRVGGPDRPRTMNAAARLLARHPEIARDSIYTATVCGDLPFVERALALQPHLAVEPGGPRGWPPLLYLSNARFPATGNALDIARTLLDHGADPNVYYPGGDPSIHYSALTCVMGRGEEQATLHPQARALAELLLERGAEPYDIQVMYNVFAGHASQRHLGDEAIWLMDLIYQHSVRRGRQADWANPDWPMIGMGGIGLGARYLLSQAIGANHVPLVEWLLAHGANPNAPPASGKTMPRSSLYQEAVRKGRTAIAQLLLQYGATPPVGESDDEDAFVTATLELDRARAQRLIAEHPEFLHSTRAMFVAGELDRADAVEFLLDLGIPADVEDPKGRIRPLHNAAYHNSPRVVTLLIERGAEIDPMDNDWGASPLGAALWGQKFAMVDLLSPFSRDVWSLASAAKIERLREVFQAEPRFARVTYENQSPLFWLPDDDQAAARVVELFLAYGADPDLKNAEGETAGDRAARRGLDTAAALLNRRTG